MGNTNSISTIPPTTCDTCNKIMQTAPPTLEHGECSACKGITISTDFKYCNFCSSNLSSCNLCGNKCQ